MLVHGTHGVAVRCDKCSSQMIIASNPRQANLQRMPSGWLQVDKGVHNCPLCTRASMATFQARRR